MVNALSRRQLLVTAGAVGLASCAGTRHNSAFWSTVTGTGSSETAASTRAYAESLPYASMLFWIAGQSRSLIVLGTIGPDRRLTWVSPEKHEITTFGPFIVATTGTEVELRQTNFGPGWGSDVRSLVGRKLERDTLVVHKGKEATARLRSTFHLAGHDSVKILGKSYQLERIDESVVADDRVRLLNSYWVDPATGACRKTVQNALPTMQPVNTEILKFPTAA